MIFKCAICGTLGTCKSSSKKYCNKCNREKTLQSMKDNFQRNKAKRVEYNKKRMQELEYRGAHNRYGRRRTLRMKEEVVAQYGKVCSCCGEAEIRFLTLDHSNLDGGAHRRQLGSVRLTGYPFYKKLKNMGFPKDLGLQVMCYNCHMAKDKYGFCPHNPNVSEE